MTLEQQLRLSIDLFKEKIKKLQEDYKNNHKDNFDSGKMDSYVNKKLKREINLLICFNIVPSIRILKSMRKI